MSSTSYYNQNRDALFEQYHAYDPEIVHRAWAPEHLKGRKPGFACDIGAGTGRDANWLAEQGWEVLAVEPSDLREPGEEKSNPRVTWLDDTLPDLQKLRAQSQKKRRRFDLILLRSVWMHVPRSKQERAFRILTELLNPSGLLVISLRGQYQHPDRSRDHVHWEWLVLENQVVQADEQHGEA